MYALRQSTLRQSVSGARHLKNEEGLVQQNYARCIGCRFCTVACPYGVRYFNWYEPEWEGSLAVYRNPDRIESEDDLEGPAVRPKGVVEKCTFCIHRLQKGARSCFR